MRKVRDYDAELKALSDRARGLKAKKVQQLGELVAATGADALDVDMLAGALLAAVGSAEAEKEAWRAKGATFFQRRARKAGKDADSDDASTAQNSPGDAAN